MCRFGNLDSNLYSPAGQRQCCKHLLRLGIFIFNVEVIVQGSTQIVNKVSNLPP